MSVQYEVRQLFRDEADHLSALHIAMNLPEPFDGIAPQVADILTRSAVGGICVDSVFGVYRSGRLASAGFVMESPGGVGLVFLPDPATAFGRDIEASRQVVVALLAASSERDVSLLQALIPPDAPGLSQALSSSGFKYLTKLVYLQRSTESCMPQIEAADDLEWLSYEPARHDLFLSALEGTYVQSLDCPELVAIRPVEETFEGHRATGEHDPDLFWVALRQGEPVGVLLLTRIRRVGALELVYIGVTQPARGKGVGDALLARAISACKEDSARFLALAVDGGNVHARRMYKRWGFWETGSRDAWLASLRVTRG